MRPVAQQCLKDLQALDDELAKVIFGVLPPGGYGASAPTSYYAWGAEATPRQKIHTLRDAAYVYAHGGDEKSCQIVLTSIRQIYEQHQKPVGSEADDRRNFEKTADADWRRSLSAYWDGVLKPYPGRQTTGSKP